MLNSGTIRKFIGGFNCRYVGVCDARAAAYCLMTEKGNGKQNGGSAEAYLGAQRPGFDPGREVYRSLRCKRPQIGTNHALKI